MSAKKRKNPAALHLASGRKIECGKMPDMAMTCSVCRHESRVVIDRMIAEGNGTVRDIAGQFGLTKSAIQRHQDHVHAAVAKAVQRSEAKTGDKLLSKWEERLDASYLAAQDGLERSGTDPENWTIGVKYIIASMKAIEMGLRVDGLIVGGEGKSTVINVDQVVVLPMGSQVRALPRAETVIDVTPVESVHPDFA